MLSVLSDLELTELRGEMTCGSRESLSRAKQSTIDALQQLRSLSARLRKVAGPEQHAVSDPRRGRGEPPAARADGQPDVHGELFLVLREAVFNAVTHAGAAHVKVNVTVIDGCINATVADDGDGFEPRLLSPADSVGLASMDERTAGIGGVLDIDSQPLRGTRVTIEVPRRDA